MTVFPWLIRPEWTRNDKKKIKKKLSPYFPYPWCCLAACTVRNEISDMARPAGAEIWNYCLARVQPRAAEEKRKENGGKRVEVGGGGNKGQEDELDLIAISYIQRMCLDHLLRSLTRYILTQRLTNEPIDPIIKWRSNQPTNQWPN